VAAVARQKLSNEEIKARLVFLVGIGLTVAFVGTIFTLLYGLLFVVQPTGDIAPNDQAAWEILKPMTLFITGGLSGMLASNGLKDRPSND